MNKILNLIILAASLTLVLVLAFWGYNTLSTDYEANNFATLAPAATAPTDATNTTQKTAPLMPDFTVYDREGNAHKLSDFRGKPVVLNFWASWCGPCQREMPYFQKAYETYGNEIHFLMVNLTDGYEETFASASGFIANNGYTFPVFYDTDLDAATTYGVYSVPVTYFVDAEGYGIVMGQGSLSEANLQKCIDMIKRNPPA